MPYSNTSTQDTTFTQIDVPNHLLPSSNSLYIALSPKCGYVILTFFSSLQHVATYLYVELKPMEH